MMLRQKYNGTCKTVAIHTVLLSSVYIHAIKIPGRTKSQQHRTHSEPPRTVLHTRQAHGQ